MKPTYLHDTIAAISTPVGKGAIAIVRLSGDKAFSIASKVFSRPDKILNSPVSHTLHYGKIINPQNSVVMDEVLLALMTPDKSFTGEPIVEIHCHGGEQLPHSILKLLLTQGARMADPGEFTRRSFLNGKIDLTQAEAIHDIIVSQNIVSSSIAVSSLEKRFSKVIYGFRQDLINILAEIEVSVDYPEEDLEPVQNQKALSALSRIQSEIDQILKDSLDGRILKRGVKVAIVGKTNAGKSSLFNYLTREDRAIVSHIHGTTRDYLETHINLQDLPVELVDTAGFRKTGDHIESIGKDRSKSKIAEADYTLWIIDQSGDWDEHDLEILSHIDSKKTILVFNKADLKESLNKDEIIKKLSPRAYFSISLLSGTGLREFETGLRSEILGADFTYNDQAIICNIRQESLLSLSKSSIQKAYEALKSNMSYEFIAIDLRDSLDFLGEIVGEVTTEDILNQIFDNFCVGK
ncbi:MAG: tRNA uridine-5-carboxymethylaminomethyl(34) synthesis GTPase MnmE [Spirochaetota bacterium]|nr:tRNA uridine-5-carboxymethylaminomethyl(34) synthesis GTPase MnmE [Spirochaetota bacterium]